MNQPPPHASSLFRGRHFDRTIIILCVRWYITYKLSYRDLVELMAERGVDISHTTIQEGFNAMSRSSRSSGDAMPVRSALHGVWTKPTAECMGDGHLYRVVDKQGLTVDFLLSEHRDIAAAKRFFTRAVE